MLDLFAQDAFSAGRRRCFTWLVLISGHGLVIPADRRHGYSAEDHLHLRPLLMYRCREMMIQDWEQLGVQTHGLPAGLFVPVAASTLEAIETHVGEIVTRVPGRKRQTNAVVVVSHLPERNPSVPLWERPDADECYRRLHPQRQLWVHVDYAGYRRAWKRLGFGDLKRGVVLDHIRNRAAVRISGYKHPFIRLCPVSRETNTSSGLDNGAEGMEKIELRKLAQQPDNIRLRMERALEAPVILADPIDLTKMLDIPPGLTELRGVAPILMQFYERGD